MPDIHTYSYRSLFQRWTFHIQNRHEFQGDAYSRTLMGRPTDTQDTPGESLKGNEAVRLFLTSSCDRCVQQQWFPLVYGRDDPCTCCTARFHAPRLVDSKVRQSLEIRSQRRVVWSGVFVSRREGAWARGSSPPLDSPKDRQGRGVLGQAQTHSLSFDRVSLTRNASVRTSPLIYSKLNNIKLQL